MASINVKESDFAALVDAANNAKERGDMALATALDVLARKANAALTNHSYRDIPKFPGMKTLTWHDVPSVVV